MKRMCPSCRVRFAPFPPCGTCHSDRGGPQFWLCIPCWDCIVGAATMQAIR